MVPRGVERAGARDRERRHNAAGSQVMAEPSRRRFPRREQREGPGAAVARSLRRQALRQRGYGEGAVQAARRGGAVNVGVAKIADPNVTRLGVGEAVAARRPGYGPRGADGTGGRIYAEHAVHPACAQYVEVGVRAGQPDTRAAWEGERPDDLAEIGRRRRRD
jgi:hypothetical protein